MTISKKAAVTSVQIIIAVTSAPVITPQCRPALYYSDTKGIKCMVKDGQISIQTHVGRNDYFRIDVGLGIRQCSPFCPLLFIIIIDGFLANELVRPPESMLFADDIVLCEASREKVPNKPTDKIFKSIAKQAMT